MADTGTTVSRVNMPPKSCYNTSNGTVSRVNMPVLILLFAVRRLFYSVY